MRRRIRSQKPMPEVAKRALSAESAMICTCSASPAPQSQVFFKQGKGRTQFPPSSGIHVRAIMHMHLAAIMRICCMRGDRDRHLQAAQRTPSATSWWPT
jgi:hypothetical protein